MNEKFWFTRKGSKHDYFNYIILNPSVNISIMKEGLGTTKVRMIKSKIYIHGSNLSSQAPNNSSVF